VPLPRIFFSNFYIKIVIFRAFWVAISYRLAVLPESEICLELAYNYSLLKIARQNDKKNAPKITKRNCRRLRCFFSYISVFILLKFLRVDRGGLGAWSPPPLTTPLCRPRAVLIFDRSQCFYRAMHFSAKRSLAIALSSVCL